MAAQGTVFANRDEPLPVVNIDIDRLSSADDVVDALLGETPSNKPRARSASDSDHGSIRGGFQERMFSLILQQVLPTTQGTSGEPTTPVRRPKQIIERPNFSLPVMSNNFRRFNQRIGIVFVFQNRVSRLLAWKTPTHTSSLLAVYTLCCLNPDLLTILPLIICLFFVMEPAFVARHPPPDSSSSLNLHTGAGPASAAPVTIKPAPETSKDFFRNMRDLQNSMEDFTVAHDGIVQLVASRTNFSDEKLSSVIYQSIFGAVLLLLIAGRLIPWRFLALITGWIVIGSGHPEAVKLWAVIDKKPLKDAYIIIRDKLIRWMDEDIILDDSPEKREVEVFELQSRFEGQAWGASIYSNSPYDLRSPVRIAGDVPKGAARFEDVQPPKTSWEWSGKKWTLSDQQWVDDRLIASVEVSAEADRWVYDTGAGPQGQATDIDVLDGVGSEKRYWRRRRWTRTVRRLVHGKGSKTKPEAKPQGRP